MNTQPPGWYPDPSGTPDLLRWWDGTAWADATQPAQPQAGAGQGDPSQHSSAQQGWYEQVQQEDDGGYQQAAYPPEAYDQDGYQQGSFPADAYDQVGYDQGGWGEAGQQQAARQSAGHEEGGYQQPGQDQAAYQQTAYQQAAYQHAGREQGGYHQGGYEQPPPQHGWPDAGGDWGSDPNWQAAEEPRKLWPWLVAGGAGLGVVVVIAVVALVASGVLGGSDDTKDPPPAALSAPASGAAQPQDSPRSPVVGRINDSRAGISYAKLGGKWAILQPGDEHGMDDWTAGQYQVAQPQYKTGKDYIATYASTSLVNAASYAGPSDLEGVTTKLAAEIEKTYYPEHTRRDIETTAVTVDGHQAWKITFALTFPQAEAENWEFHGERVVIMLIDLGQGKPPAAFYFTLPDNLPLQADMKTVVSSIKVTG